MNIIDQITTYIIRPTREKYHINRLGPRDIDLPISTSHSISHANIVRYDGHAVNARRQKIVYSVYVSSHAERLDSCVIYLHANNGSRVEGLHYLQDLFRAGYNVCILDLAGSGLSEGQYVTLGLNESEDLRAVADELRYKFGIRKLTLWGRSMGACTAIIYASEHPQDIVALILDSPFKDLGKLIKQTASERTGMPKFFFQPLLALVDRSLHDKVGYHLSQYKMKQYMDLIPSHIPMLFVVSKDDTLVKPHHGEKLYQRSNSTLKQIEYITVPHHEVRDLQVIRRCLKFMWDARAYSTGSTGLPVGQNNNNNDIMRSIKTHNAIQQEQQKKRIRDAKFSFSAMNQKTPTKSPQFQFCPIREGEDKKAFIDLCTNRGGNLYDNHQRGYREKWQETGIMQNQRKENNNNQRKNSFFNQVNMVRPDQQISVEVTPPKQKVRLAKRMSNHHSLQSNQSRQRFMKGHSINNYSQPKHNFSAFNPQNTFPPPNYSDQNRYNIYQPPNQHYNTQPIYPSIPPNQAPNHRTHNPLNQSVNQSLNTSVKDHYIRQSQHHNHQLQNQKANYTQPPQTHTPIGYPPNINNNSNPHISNSNNKSKGQIQLLQVTPLRNSHNRKQMSGKISLSALAHHRK